MIRTQIQLTEKQASKLKEIAAAEGRSMADVIRESVEVYTASRGVRDRQEEKAAAISIVGRFRSGRKDLGSRHDDHLAEVFDE
jgi:predicted DNA-binding protein